MGEIEGTGQAVSETIGRSCVGDDNTSTSKGKVRIKRRQYIGD